MLEELESTFENTPTTFDQAPETVDLMRAHMDAAALRIGAPVPGDDADGAQLERSHDGGPQPAEDGLDGAPRRGRCRLDGDQAFAAPASLILRPVLDDGDDQEADGAR